MLVATLVTVLSLQATAAQTQRVSWVPNPRRTGGGWVADPSHHLAPATVATLNQEIGALERETSAEIAVVVVDSTSGLTPFDFALTLHRVWGVGKSGKDNGLVVLWVPAQRSIFISVGPGLQGVLPDRRTGRIRDEQIFPAFRRGAFDEGVLAGVRALAAVAREETHPRQGITSRLQDAGGVDASREAARRALRGAAESAAGRTIREGQSGGAGAKVAAVIGGLLAVIGGAIASVLGWRGYRRRRPRACSKCGTPMSRLDEQSEDEFLDKGDQAEERVRSVDYDVWHCRQCSETLKIPYRRRFSQASKCPQCNRLTVRTTSTTIAAATTLSEGLRHLALHCANCDWHSETDVVIPRVVPSSSDGSSSGGGGSDSGGGGGSDFGGGSSDGGGAGGTY